MNPRTVCIADNLVLPLRDIPDGTDTWLSVLIRPIGGAYDDPAIICLIRAAASPLAIAVSVRMVSLVKNPRESRQCNVTEVAVSSMSEM